MTYSGIDMVYTARFMRWDQYNDNQLSTLFSKSEINNFHQQGESGYQFLASRFAVKEACYKAISSACAHMPTVQPFGLRTIARFIEITHDQRWGCPQLHLDNNGFFAATDITLPSMIFSVSISHEKEYAIAVVLLSL